LDGFTRHLAAERGLSAATVAAYTADVKEAMKNPNVKFKVCAIALRNNNIDKSQLLPEVEAVPDGIYELVSKQQDHWGYIKVMH